LFLRLILPKTKYLDGYSIDLFLAPKVSDDDGDHVVREVLQTLPDSKLTERHGHFLRFDISNVSSRSGLALMFSRLEQLKNLGSDRRRRLVERYSIRQCDLEQVFMKLVVANLPDTASRRSQRKRNERAHTATSLSSTCPAVNDREEATAHESASLALPTMSNVLDAQPDRHHVNNSDEGCELTPHDTQDDEWSLRRWEI